MASVPFKPFGTPPQLDLDEYKDSFEIWEKKWKVFLAISTIDSSLKPEERGAYKCNTLMSCMTTATLRTVMTMGLTDAEAENHLCIIAKLKTMCNSGRNRHVWRHKFMTRSQRENEPADDWLCDLRDIASKCEFNSDCCSQCEPTRILGQIIFGVQDDDVRLKFLEKGANLTLDQAINTLRTAEATMKQAANLRDSVGMQQIARSTYKKEGGMGGFRASTEETETAGETKNQGLHCQYCDGERQTGANARHPARDAQSVAKWVILPRYAQEESNKLEPLAC